MGSDNDEYDYDVIDKVWLEGHKNPQEDNDDHNVDLVHDHYGDYHNGHYDYDDGNDDYEDDNIIDKVWLEGHKNPQVDVDD